MQKFYFTYGSSKNYPFHGGWTEVIAPNEHMAVGAFNAVHPPVSKTSSTAPPYMTKRHSTDLRCPGTAISVSSALNV